MHLFTRSRLDSFRSIRIDELRRLCDALKVESSKRDGLVDVRRQLHRMALNTVLQVTLSKRYESSVPGHPNVEGDAYFDMIKEFFEIGGTFNPADYIPFLRPFDPVGVYAKASKCNAKLKKFFLNEIREHRERLANKQAGGENAEDLVQDFCDVLLTAEPNEHLTEMVTVGILSDILAGGSDTSSITLEWAMLELLRHPEKLRRLQAELDAALGPPQYPPYRNLEEEQLETQLSQLPYLKAVIKETFRLHPAAPLLVPHYTTQIVQLGNGKYSIPANTTIFVSTWAIGRDPAVWPQPDKFEPERFLEEDVDVRGMDYRILPFGAGRRTCPGQSLALLVLQLALAGLVHMFEWTEGPKGLDNSEKFNNVISPLIPLEAVVTPRV